ncbi:BZ3500_MvSof-1268-A1-R1_Chr8-1g09992 [Microbotryum saponariae]|uniref:BZ3500_MvSof-1268-A1-R1_Chr8-1g09992 protein n=1 Tax=Microbotryum saponariae TaxID=289078 RepID=A0A2X0LRY5_9BASI|nr:BZ3500_MvSof-1268-A1-R1_Chr8-1g09992 [Microbotryum saponariae]SDA08278.1 BZ3501_MvSof-1269-A2-R1_Chr8-1g09715 [Microbotryum saponariae]
MHKKLKTSHPRSVDAPGVEAQSIHGSFLDEPMAHSLGSESHVGWAAPDDDGVSAPHHLQLELAEDHARRLYDYSQPRPDHDDLRQARSSSRPRSSYRLSSHYPLESSNPRPPSRSADRGDRHQVQHESPGKFDGTSASSHPSDARPEISASSSLDRLRLRTSVSNKEPSSETSRDNSPSTIGRDDFSSGQTSVAAASPSAPFDAMAEPLKDQVKSKTTQSVDLLAMSLDLLSFLKEHRPAFPVIKLPIPIASSSEAQGVVGEALSGHIGRASSNATSRGAAATTVDGWQISRSQRARTDPWVCSGCHRDLGWLLLRGPASAEATSYRAVFLCNDCSPIAKEPERSHSGHVENMSEPSYYNSFTRFVEEESGHPLPEPRPHAGPDRVRPRKKRKEMEDSSAACDVCTRIIASGSISAIDRDEAPPDLLVEFICASCHDRYRRCTDCGSRFTPRVGTGKWRLKELFADGVKSCSIPHRPLVLEDTTCDTWRLSDLPHGSDEFAAFLHETHKALVGAVMVVIAIPDTMESDAPFCVDFRTAAMVCNDLHSILSSLVTQDIEEELGIRRYLALRWHNPSKQERSNTFVLQPQDPDVIAQERPERLMREGYSLHSYVFAELDLKHGSVGIHAMVPRGIGHSYFAQSLLVQALLVRMRADLLETNTSRVAQGLMPFPKIHEVWNFMTIGKSSRVLQRDESQRGMIELDQYLEQYKDVTDPSHFPPIRPFFLPNAYLSRYRFWARRFGEGDDLTAIQRSRYVKAATKRRQQQSVPTGLPSVVGPIERLPPPTSTGADADFGLVSSLSMSDPPPAYSDAVEASHPSCSAEYAIGSSGSTAASWTDSELRKVSSSRHFHDQFDRRLLLHGCNLSGINKLPSKPDGATHVLNEGWWDHENVSFVGRPFPLDEAHDHLARLSQWGLTFVRFVVTWEALEHSGPGQYDMDYIDYLRSLISLFPKYGIKCYIDAHQDVWSRHTGGSGAPTWTLELVGFDIRNLKATGAAHAHNLNLDDDDPAPQNWPSGYSKLAGATMATLFWAGETFAPKRQVERGQNAAAWGQDAPDEMVGVQVFMQKCMIGAFGALADALKNLPAVIGFEVMNEPHPGYIGVHSPYSFNLKKDLAIGHFPTAVQSWALGAGHSVLIDHYGPSFPVTAVTHQTLISPPKGITAWKEGAECVWKEQGVWAWDEKKKEALALRIEYFNQHPETGAQTDWAKDFYFPFCRDFGERVKEANPRWYTMAGPLPNEPCPRWTPEGQPHNLIYAPHWYDLQALFTKSLGFMTANVQGLARGMFLLRALYFGRNGIRKNYTAQIREVIQSGYRTLGELPIILGETGVPFDLNGKQAFATGDFSWQERQMDAICSALERNLISFNLWNYNPLNTDQWGDSWNAENFSWFSQSDMTRAKFNAAKSEDERLNVGARVLDAVERPYASKVAGIPYAFSYDFKLLQCTFSYVNPTSPKEFRTRRPQNLATTHDPPIPGTTPRSRETEIYLPRRRFGGLNSRLKVRLSDGEWKYDEELQTLYVLHTNLTPGFIHTVRISVDGEVLDALLIIAGMIVLGITMTCALSQYDQEWLVEKVLGKFEL